MNYDNILIDSFSFSGYRSFGKDIQRFEKLSKINLFIGSNNCGKSNVLRFIHDIYPELAKRKGILFNPIDQHMPSGARFVIGCSISIEKIKMGSLKVLITKFSQNLERALEEHKPQVMRLEYSKRKKS